jgi:hypothetical protein
MGTEHDRSSETRADDNTLAEPPRADAANDASTRPRRGPRLVVLRDVDARADVGTPCFGSSLLARVVVSARQAGFAETLLGPGVRARDVELGPDVREAAIGELVEGAALVVHEGTWIDPALLVLMVRHPLDEDDAHSLYDAQGRPAAYFSGDLGEVPGLMPLAEELTWPEGLGPHSLVRVVEPGDMERATWALALSAGELHDRGSRFERNVVMPTLRWLASTERTVSQLELLALASCLLAVPLVLGLGWIGLVLGMLLTLLGVHVSRVLHSLRLLRGEEGSPGGWAWIPGDTFARATRPLAHAALSAALTYVLVAQTSRPALASGVLLVVGGASAIVSLAHARAILRDQGQLTLRLPRGDRFFARIEVSLPQWLEGAPLLESLALCLSVIGHPALPWAVFVGAAMARSWRWFVGPERSFAPAQTTSGDDDASGNSSAARRLTPS